MLALHLELRTINQSEHLFESDFTPFFHVISIKQLERSTFFFLYAISDHLGSKKHIFFLYAISSRLGSKKHIKQLLRLLDSDEN